MNQSLANRWAPYLFLAPFILSFGVFTLYPLLSSIGMSTEQTYGPGYTADVGLKNYFDIFQDPKFYTALWNTLVYAFWSVSIILPCSLGLALLLNHPKMKGRVFYRSMLFMPALVGAVFVGVIFGIVFQKRSGLLNRALNSLFNVNPDFDWLGSYVMPALIIASLWMWVGFNMIYFLAALQNVDKDLTEAATIDGAGPWDRFRHVTLPAIMPVLNFVLLVSIIGSIQLFELPYLMLNGPGPDDQGLTLVMYLFFYGFERGNLGYASAVGWVLAILLVSLAMIQRRLSRKEAY